MNDNKITRRVFLKLTGAAGGAAILPHSVTTKEQPTQQACVSHPGVNDATCFKLAKFSHRNLAQQTVVGYATFNEQEYINMTTACPDIFVVNMVRWGDGWRINYGWRRSGDIFFVHTRDIEAKPDVFVVNTAG